MEVKIDEKSIKKWSQDGKASWHRFLMDFGGFLEASWEGKWSQDRSQEASNTLWKNGRHQDGHKVRIGRSNASRNQGSRALGRGLGEEFMPAWTPSPPSGEGKLTVSSYSMLHHLRLMQLTYLIN